MAAVSPPFFCAPIPRGLFFGRSRCREIMLAIGTYALYCGMKKIAALFMAATGIAYAQTYNCDAANETLVIKGKGNSVADLNITSSVGSLEIGAAAGGISATDVSNGLNVGDVGNVNVSGTNVNVLDGKTVSGDIVSTAHQRRLRRGHRLQHHRTVARLCRLRRGDFGRNLPQHERGHTVQLLKKRSAQKIPNCASFS